MSDKKSKASHPQSTGTAQGGSGDNPVSEAAPENSPGCMPAVLASAIIAAIVGFISCGVLTWLIFQKQDVLALRAMRGSVIPAVEQSLLSPEEKAASVKLLGDFADQLERKQIDGWQASGVMQRLGRLPIIQWGQVRRLEKYVDDHAENFEDDASVQFDRLRKGVERNKVTRIDFVHILSPVLQPGPQGEDAPLVEDWTDETLTDVIHRARLVADRGEVEADIKTDITMDTLIRRQIEAGIKDGTY